MDRENQRHQRSPSNPRTITETASERSDSAQPAPVLHPPVAGAVIFVSDIVCPVSYVAVHRLLTDRWRHGFDDEVVIDHRALPLELLDGGPMSLREMESQVAVCSRLAPELDWSRDPARLQRPTSSIPSLEAVQAAKDQGAELSVALDRALRQALFAENRSLETQSDVLQVADDVARLDAKVLGEELASGRPAAEVRSQVQSAAAAGITISPTIVLASGRLVPGAGIELQSGSSGGYEIVTDDVTVIEDLVLKAASGRAAE